MWEWHARARDFPVWREVTDSVLASLLPAPVLALVEAYVGVESPPLFRMQSSEPGHAAPFETLGGFRVVFRLEDDSKSQQDAAEAAEAAVDDTLVQMLDDPRTLFRVEREPLPAEEELERLLDKMEPYTTELD
jgi:hypothetical protein